MTEVERHPVLFDREVQEALRGVRFVFELGFPTDLVNRSRALIARLNDPRRPGHKREPRFPGCYLLAVVAAARSYDGHSLWSSELLGFINASPEARAQMAIESLGILGLDTFHELVDQENALRRMSPILMHAGLPTRNVPDLVELVSAARRNHILSAEEQIARWSRTPNGFAGLWRAPQLFFRFGGDAATDLLERVNEALDSDDPLSVGLPRHLAEAIGQLDQSTIEMARQLGSRRSIQRPQVLFDPWSCEGPVLQLGAADPLQVARWRVSGAVSLETRARNQLFEMPLLPAAEWSAQAIDPSGSTVGSWTYPAYSELQVMVFDAGSGRLLRHRAGSREVESGMVHVLARSEVVITGGDDTGAVLPEPVGDWHQWRTHEFAVSGTTELVCVGPAESQQVIRLVAPPRRPELSRAGLLENVVGSQGEIAFDRAPDLLINPGAVDPNVIMVRVTGENGRQVSATLADLGDGMTVNLGCLIAQDGKHDIAVDGPLGLRLRPTKIIVVRGLRTHQTPSPLLPGESGTVTLSSETDSMTIGLSTDESEIECQFGPHLLRLPVERARWAVRLPGAAAEPLGTDLLSLSVEDLVGVSPALLTVDLGVAKFAEVQLQQAGEPLQTLRPTRLSNRWTMSLGALSDTVVAALAESLDLVLVLGGRSVKIGRVVSTYVPTLTDVRVDPDIEPAVIEIGISENKAFRQRVARVWNLERPWEPSIRVEIPDDARRTVLVPLPADHKAGRYRVWIRVEDPWTLPPDIPSQQVAGMTDVDVECGVGLDVGEPIDRIIAATRGDLGVLSSEDLELHGDLLIFLLVQGIADHGSRFVSTTYAAHLLGALRRHPASLLRSISRAVEGGAVKRGVAGALAVALAPLLLELEEQYDLSLDPEIAEIVWSLMPLAAAVVEPWDDSNDALERWARYLGWPVISDDDKSKVEFPALPRLPEEFSRQFLLLAHRPEFALDLAGLSEQLLHRELQFRSLLSALTLFGAPEVDRWVDRYDGTLRRVRGDLNEMSATSLTEDASLRRVTGSDWILSDIAALSASLISNSGSSADAHMALMDAYDLAPQWATHCLLFVIAERGRREMFKGLV